MLKSILEKAIGEDKVKSDLDYLDGTGYKNEGYNLAKAEMRAKIPQVVEEVIGIIRDILKREEEAKADSTIIEEIEYVF